MHVNFRLLCAVAVSGLLTSTLAFAQPPEDESESENEIPSLPPVTVTAPFPSGAPLSDDTVITPSRTPTPAATNASSVSVITGDEIRRSGQTNVAEVLRRTVGLDVARTGGPGRTTTVFIRGGNSEHTKVLLDGIPLNDPANFSRGFDFSTIATDNIERIEVLRGPQSMVYGSDAIGGVVNIITKRGNGPLSATATLMGGSFGTHQEILTASGGDDESYYSVSGSYFETEGISAVNERFGGVERDGFQNGTFSGRFGLTPSEAVNIDYVFRYIDADSETDGFQADNLVSENRRNLFFNRVQLQSTLFDGLVQQTVGFSLNDSVLRDPTGFFARFEGQTRQFDYQANVLLADTECFSNTFTLGTDYQHEEALSSLDPLVKQNIAGVYLQNQFSLWNRSFTTIGVRWDDHSVAGTADTYRLTQLFDFPETGTQFHGTIGRGFRAPALFQLLPPFGNPALRPEFSKGWDVGATQELFEGDLVFDATYFRNDFDNLIIFDFNTFMSQNIGVARTSGVELTLDAWLTASTSMSVGYTYMEPHDFVSGQDLLRRARNKASVNVHHEFYNNRAMVDLYLLSIDDRLDFGGVPIEDYFLVNTSASFQVTENIELFGRIDNLFDEDYEEVFGFGTAGISFFGGARINL